MSKNIFYKDCCDKFVDYVKKSHITTQKEQKSEKTAQDVQKNCLSLTEQYEVGGTPICKEGSYVYTENGIEKVHYCQVGCITERVTPKANILAEVPSYEEWQKYVEANENMFSVVKMLNKDNYQLEKDINKLKELLSKCVSRVDTLSDILDFLKDKVVYKQSKQLADMLKSTREIIKEIDEVLK
jgi:hypothetical protein